MEALIPETVLACSTAPGRSDTALVRISGPGAAVCAAQCNITFARGCGRGWLSFAVPGAPKAKVPIGYICMVAPASYTGEDTLELLVPGNPVLVQRIISELIARCNEVGCHARTAQPGEFSARAYLAGKLDIVQAEGIAAMIAATTQDQIDAAQRLRSGVAGKHYITLQSKLATLLALVEAGIDFTDQEDVVSISPSRLRRELHELIAGVQQDLHLSATRPNAGLPMAVLIGKPNAGKSTLFNALVGHERAVVSSVAGTTRDIVTATLTDEHGDYVMLADAAGLDSVLALNADEPERIGQQHTLAAVVKADVLIWCDPTGRFEAGALPGEANQRITSLSQGFEAGRVIRVRTFGDLPATSIAGAIIVCAMNDHKLTSLRRALRDAATLTSENQGLAGVLPRHAAALQRSLASMQAALATVDPQTRMLLSPEQTAGELRAALDAMGELAGYMSPDDVLGRVFASFCVGK